MHCSSQVEPQSDVEPQSFYGKPQSDVEPPTSVELAGTLEECPPVASQRAIVGCGPPQPWHEYLSANQFLCRSATRFFRSSYYT